MRQAYICDKCQGQYSVEAEAVACEASHPTAESMKIVGVNFRSVTNTWGLDRGMAQAIPDTIFIKFSDRHGDSASYTLKHYGFKGI